MRAWRFTGTDEPLHVAELPDPVAGHGDVVIDVRGAGLCHTDVGVLEQPEWLRSLAHRPITMGHEVAGVVTEVGPGVEGWRVGDRVGICPSTPAGAPGFARDGGFGERLAFAASALVRMPAEVPFGVGATATDAGMTSHHAVLAVGELRAGQRLGVIGLGGLGQIGARLGVLAGAEVYVAEIDESVWPLAHELGATAVASSIRDFEAEGLDVIVDFAGFGTTTADAVETVRHRGRVVQIGLGRLDALISTRALITRHVTLVGSSGGTPADIEACYRLLASGELTPRTTSIAFDDIFDGLGRLQRGEVTGRLVAELPGEP